MTRLAAHQHAFARALRDDRGGDRDSGGDGDGDALARLLTTDASTSARRLAIYRVNSISSATKALAGTYPVIREVVGVDFFDALARAYWTSTPSRSGDLGDYGDSFDAFLAGFEHVRELPYLADLARLEWAVHRAECAVDAPEFNVTTLADVPAERQSALVFEFVPGTAIVESSHPIVRIWNLHRDEGAGVAASPMQAPATDPAQADARGLDWAVDWTVAETALVVRNGYEVRVVALDAGNAAALHAIRSGASFGDALAAGLAAAESAVCPFDIAAAPANWLRDGLFAGFRFLDLPLENTDAHDR